jgi:hypothetical protein
MPVESWIEDDGYYAVFDLQPRDPTTHGMALFVVSRSQRVVLLVRQVFVDRTTAQVTSSDLYVLSGDGLP